MTGPIPNKRLFNLKEIQGKICIAGLGSEKQNRHYQGKEPTRDAVVDAIGPHGTAQKASEFGIACQEVETKPIFGSGHRPQEFFGKD